MNIDQQRSDEIIDKLEDGTCEQKPGWIRFSIHPTTTNSEIAFVCDSIISLVSNYKVWEMDYLNKEGKFVHRSELEAPASPISKNWFQL